MAVVAPAATSRAVALRPGSRGTPPAAVIRRRRGRSRNRGALGSSSGAAFSASGRCSFTSSWQRSQSRSVWIGADGRRHGGRTDHATASACGGIGHVLRLRDAGERGRRARRALAAADQLVRAGRAWRLLPGARDRALRTRRRGRGHRDGRPTGQHDATPARGTLRAGAGTTGSGAEGHRQRTAAGGDRDHVPERHWRVVGASGYPHHRRPQGPPDPDQHRDAHDVLAVAHAHLRIHRRSGGRLHVQHPALRAQPASGDPGFRDLGALCVHRARGSLPLPVARRCGLSRLRKHAGDDTIVAGTASRGAGGVSLRQHAGLEVGAAGGSGACHGRDHGGEPGDECGPDRLVIRGAEADAGAGQAGHVHGPARG